MTYSIDQACFDGRSGERYRSESGEALLLQKAPSGPLGSNVLLMDVGITSKICESRDPSGDVQEHLHGNNLESGLRDE